MAATPTPQDMVDQLLAALAANPAGVVSVTSDGQTVTYSRTQALAELKEWEARAAKAANKRQRVSSFNLSRF